MTFTWYVIVYSYKTKKNAQQLHTLCHWISLSYSNSIPFSHVRIRLSFENYYNLFARFKTAVTVSNRQAIRTSQCSTFEWQCDSGQCIDSSEACDGVRNCRLVTIENSYRYFESERYIIKKETAKQYNTNHVDTQLVSLSFFYYATCFLITRKTFAGMAVMKPLKIVYQLLAHGMHFDACTVDVFQAELNAIITPNA